MTVAAQSTNIGLFWSKGQEVAGGKIETGVTIAIEKINNNSNILGNTTLRFFPYRGNCEKKKILTGAIKFVAPELMDLLIGDLCQITTELGGLVASQYNIPFFDFSTIPIYMTDQNYGTLLRAGGDANNFRRVYLAVAQYQNFTWNCFFAPKQIQANVVRVVQTIDTHIEDKKAFVIKNFYFDLITNDYSALKEIKTSCRGL